MRYGREEFTPSFRTELDTKFSSEFPGYLSLVTIVAGEITSAIVSNDNQHNHDFPVDMVAGTEMFYARFLRPISIYFPKGGHGWKIANPIRH